MYKMLFKIVSLGVGSLVLTGCASQSSSLPTAIPSPSSSVYVLAGGGGSQIDADTLDGQLTVAEDTSASAHVGLGYQFNSVAAVELRVADLGEVVFDDDRTLGYQVVDASGVFTWRQRHASLFARLGVGTFQNDGDFDVELQNSAHAVFGSGLAYHASSNVDLRLSVSAHDADAVWGNFDIVWRFGGRSNNRAESLVTTSDSAFDANSADGYQSIEPLRADNAVNDTAETSNSEGLLIDNEPAIEFTPVPTVNPIPEPIVASESVPNPEPVVATNTGAPSEPVLAIVDNAASIDLLDTPAVVVSDEPAVVDSLASESLTTDASSAELIVPAVSDSIEEITTTEASAVIPEAQSKPEDQINSGATAEVVADTIEKLEAPLLADADTALNAVDSGDDPATSLIVAAINPELTPAESDVEVVSDTSVQDATEDAYVTNSLLPVEPFQFNQGGTTLLEPSVESIDGLVELLGLNPTLNLVVEAHAAPGGDATVSMLLSRRRALTMIRLLVDRGIEPQRLRPRAFGDTAPLTNASALEMNDRVVMRVR